MRVSALAAFIDERQMILVRRTRGDPPPWTEDPILREYRFCNVHREDDRVTKWIAENWREPNQREPDLWFAMCVARLVNWPATLAWLGYPVPWRPARFVRYMRGRLAAGDKVWGGAYIVSTNGNPMLKEEYIAERVLSPLWNNRRALRPRKGQTLEDFHERLMRYDGMGSFLAGQVVADLKYVDPLLQADDWWSFAASGPGSRRGLNRVLERPVDEPWREDEWYDAIVDLTKDLIWEVSFEVGSMHMQDLQNCLCEFDKYERVRLGQGKPRAKFRGALQ